MTIFTGLGDIGVEGVVIDMAQNQVTIKGVVEPQAVCTTIEKKTKRRAKVLSPLPAAEGEPIPEVVASQVSYYSILTNTSRTLFEVILQVV